MVALKNTTKTPVSPSKRERIEAQIAVLQAQLAALPEDDPDRADGKIPARRVRLSSSAIDALPLPATGALLYWFEPDARGRKVPGFGIRIASTGVRSFQFQTRTAAGKPVKLSLGRHPALSPEQARALAAEAFATIARGGDPAADRAAARAEEEARRAAETLPTSGRRSEPSTSSAGCARPRGRPTGRGGRPRSRLGSAR